MPINFNEFMFIPYPEPIFIDLEAEPTNPSPSLHIDEFGSNRVVADEIVSELAPRTPEVIRRFDDQVSKEIENQTSHRVENLTI